MKKLTKEEIDNHLRDHLPYEKMMLEYTFKKISESPTSLTTEDWNAYYESFAVHARILAEFLSNKDKKNLQAGQFITGFCEAKPPNLTGPFIDLNEQVLHIGKKRPTESDKKVSIETAEKIYLWLNSAFDKFLDELPETMKELWDRRVIKNEVALRDLDACHLYLATSGGPTGPNNMTVQISSRSLSSSSHPSFSSMSTTTSSEK